MEYARTLEHLGLTKNEAALYVALLRLGEGSVQDIARDANVKRPTAYVLLEELRKKEAVLVVPQAKRKLYRARPPHELYEQHAERLDKVARAIPELEALHKKEERANVLYFEGVQGVKQALYHRQNELSGTEITGFWGKVDTWDKQTKKVTEKWNKELPEHNITVRAIAPDHPSLAPYRKTDAGQGRTVKVVPQNKYSANSAIEATDAFVRITQFDTPQSVIIESSEFTKTVREIFEMVWETH